MHLQCDLHGGLECVGCFRDDDADGLDLIDAGVGCIKAAGDTVETDFAVDAASHVIEQGGVFFVREVHGLNSFRARSPA